MRTIVTAPGPVSDKALMHIRAEVASWVEAPQMPLVVADGLAVRVYDDEWNLVAESPMPDMANIPVMTMTEPVDRRPMLLALAGVALSILAILLVLTHSAFT